MAPIIEYEIRANFRKSVEAIDAAGALDPAAREEALKEAEALFLKTHETLIKVRDQRNLKAGNCLESGELLVLAAEAAVKHGRYDVAASVCKLYFLDIGFIEDQFLCRTLFVQALVEGHAAAPLHGAEGVRRRRLAVGYVLDALKVPKLRARSSARVGGRRAPSSHIRSPRTRRTARATTSWCTTARVTFGPSCTRS